MIKSKSLLLTPGGIGAELFGSVDEKDWSDRCNRFADELDNLATKVRAGRFARSKSTVTGNAMLHWDLGK